MTSEVGRGEAVLLVAPGDSAWREWLHVCPDAVVECVADDADARRRLKERAFARVVMAFGGTASDHPALLKDAAVLQPTIERVVCVEDEALAEVMRTGVARSADRVVPRPKTREALLQVLTGGRLAAQACERLPEALLSWTAALAARLPEAVVRARKGAEVQLVVQAGAAFETFRRALEERWNGPAEVPQGRDGDAAPSLLREVGALKRGQSVYARTDGELSCVLLVLPWTNARRVTLVLRAHGCGVEAAMEAARAAAVSELRTYYIPEGLPHPSNPQVRYLAEYDWVATPTYVGPDRRRRSTSLFNRYAFFGRRTLLAESTVSSSFSGFVDKVPRTVAWLVWAGALLCLVDAALTMHFVTARRVQELNPLLRPLVAEAPVLFWTLKTLGTTIALAVVARFHSFAGWRWLLPALVGLYLLLVLYWGVLLG